MITIERPEQTIELLEVEVNNMIACMRQNDLFRGFLDGSVDIEGYRRVAHKVVNNYGIELTPELEERINNPAREDIVALNTSAYTEWLPQVVNYIKHNPGFIRTAAQTMEELVGKGRHEYWIPHHLLKNEKTGAELNIIEACYIDTGEETGHHLYAAKDALALGVALDTVFGTPQNQAVQDYLSALDTAVRSDTPLGFEGAAYILTKWAAMRGNSSIHRMYHKLIERSGIPNIENAVSVWELHAKVDQHHIQDQTNEILATPLKYGDHQAMVDMAQKIGRAYARIPRHLPLNSFAGHLRSTGNTGPS